MLLAEQADFFLVCTPALLVTLACYGALVVLLLLFWGMGYISRKRCQQKFCQIDLLGQKGSWEGAVSPAPC